MFNKDEKLTCEDCNLTLLRNEWIECGACNRKKCFECCHYYVIGEAEAYCDYCITKFDLTLNSEIWVARTPKAPLPYVRGSLAKGVIS